VAHRRQRYLWGPAGDQILAEEAVDNGTDETVQWTLMHHVNTVRDIAKYDPDDDMATVVDHFIYDAFGRVTSESNPAVGSLFLFTARPFDPDTGLQNNLNRWYDPAVGRWLSEDPIGFGGGNGNLYPYVGNEPLGKLDFVGLGTCDARGERFLRRPATIHAIPVSIGKDFQTNPGPQSEGFLTKLWCVAVAPVIARYICCCDGKEHVVYQDAMMVLSQTLDVLGHQVWVKTISFQIPLPPPLDNLPFGPAVTISVGFADNHERIRAEVICRNAAGRFMQLGKVVPGRVDCPYH